MVFWFLLVVCVFFLFFIRVGKVSGNSMYPTLKNGEYFLYLDLSFLPKKYLLKVWDIVVFRHYYEDKGLVRFVKRIKCLPGYKVFKDKDGLYDCHKIWTWIILSWYFLVWDNTGKSLDSRYCFSYWWCRTNPRWFSIDKKDLVGKIILKF